MKAIFGYILFLVLMALGAAYLNLLSSNLGMVLIVAILTAPFVASTMNMSSSSPDPSQDIKNIEKAIQTQSQALSLIISKIPG